MTLSETDIESLRALQTLLRTSFKGASFGSLKIDDGVAALDNVIGAMNEARAREILGDRIIGKRQLLSVGYNNLNWLPRHPKPRGLIDGPEILPAYLNGQFTADELEAIAWWMRNMNKERP